MHSKRFRRGRREGRDNDDAATASERGRKFYSFPKNFAEFLPAGILGLVTLGTTLVELHTALRDQSTLSSFQMTVNPHSRSSVSSPIYRKAPPSLRIGIDKMSNDSHRGERAPANLVTN